MRAFGLLVVALSMFGCSGSDPSTGPHPDRALPSDQEAPVVQRERVSERPGNTDGVVFVAMYHRVMPEEGSYTRSVEGFKRDLQRLYDMGFRPVTLGEYIDDKMDLAPGASPIGL